MKATDGDKVRCSEAYTGKWIVNKILNQNKHGEQKVNTYEYHCALLKLDRCATSAKQDDSVFAALSRICTFKSTRATQMLSKNTCDRPTIAHTTRRTQKLVETAAYGQALTNKH